MEASRRSESEWQGLQNEVRPTREGSTGDESAAAVHAMRRHTQTESQGHASVQTSRRSSLK